MLAEKVDPAEGRPQEILVLVDENDNFLGTDTRERCHAGKGIRHRAYVVFLFHEGKMLVQQRSSKKLLWPGYWDVSFTSHVYPGETYNEAAARRGLQELDARFGKLQDVFGFVYWVPFGENSENEYCKLLVGEFDGKVKPNPDEIMNMGFEKLKDVAADMKANPDSYTPWFKIAVEGFLKSPLSKPYLN